MSQMGLEFILGQLHRVPVEHQGVLVLIRFYDSKVREYELQNLDRGVHMGAKEFYEQKHKFARDALRPELLLIQQRYVSEVQRDSLSNARRLGVIP